MVTYRELTAEEVGLSMFSHFDRTQNVSRCWRKQEGRWVIRDVVFVDNWTPAEYDEGVLYLARLIAKGGYLAGAFSEGHLKGFVSVEQGFFGDRWKYMNLSNIHVSRDMRGKGLGRTLFHMATKWAQGRGAEKLYISAHSAVESQAFYKAMGCVEALEYNAKLVEKEPFDCQLEFVL